MQIPLPIIAALTGALVAGCFSLLTLIFVLRNERRKRREEASLKHLQCQIEELYGPLCGLLQFGAAINEIEWLRLPKEARNERGEPLNEEGGKVLTFFREHYYLPLNERIIELIRTKIYLLESEGVPDSFATFIRHAAHLDCFHQLWKKTEISTHGIRIDYPTNFRSDVEGTLNELRREYNEYIRRMKGTPQIAQLRKINQTIDE